MISEIKSTINNYEIGSPIPSNHTEEFDLLLNKLAADECVREDDFVSLPMTERGVEPGPGHCAQVWGQLSQDREG